MQSWWTFRTRSLFFLRGQVITIPAAPKKRVLFLLNELARMRCLFFPLGSRTTLPQRAQKQELPRYVLNGWVVRCVVIGRVLRIILNLVIVTSKLCWFEIWYQKLYTGIGSKVLIKLSFIFWTFNDYAASWNEQKMT